jgi:NAD(P)-dependent dehydrogenase (short-subunit alcohol dehydrogenase family)
VLVTEASRGFGAEGARTSAAAGAAVTLAARTAEPTAERFGAALALSTSDPAKVTGRVISTDEVLS